MFSLEATFWHFLFPRALSPAGTLPFAFVYSIRAANCVVFAQADCTTVPTWRGSFPVRYEYHWADGTNIKKPIKCSAPKYIDYLMTWVQDQLDDETLFPSKIGESSSLCVWLVVSAVLLIALVVFAAEQIKAFSMQSPIALLGKWFDHVSKFKWLLPGLLF